MCMLIEEFKSGKYEKGFDYEYFVPTKINRNWNWKNSELSLLLEKASLGLGEINSYGRIVPNISLFIQLYVKKEAVISSRIEGTQTGINEAIMPEEEISSEKRTDWREVRNYSLAMNEAIEKLNKLPLSSRLLKNIHRTLMEGVRGKHKLPGEFRTSQNWIGGTTLKDAVFIPPAHHLVNDLMGDLENFIHNREISVPDLIKIGIIHYQFETIHPFLDGNGRIGRLLIPLYMIQKNILNKPLLYLSEYFEKDRTLYYENLMKVRNENNLLHWLKYFLIGIGETSKRASKVLNNTLKLKENTEKLLRKEAGRRADSALILFEELFKSPVVKVNDVIRICNLSKK
ncbi:MAG: Fic family protein, partial [Bacteroidetes bacterium]